MISIYNSIDFHNVYIVVQKDIFMFDGDTNNKNTKKEVVVVA